MVLDTKVCNATNTAVRDESDFFSENSINWDAHRIGWVIAGSMSILSIIISAYTIHQHATHYHRPLEQRQIIRIILMPPVYAVISFFSYRFFRAFTYYHLVETVYEAFAIGAFLFLLVQYIGNAPASQRVILSNAPKASVPFPFCFWRYRPSKPYFLHAIKWLVLQYCIFRPLITIVGIICEANHVLCATQYSVYFAQVYLEAIDFIVFSLALYGLMVFYTVTKIHLKGQSPLAKFLTIKGIVFFTFYQGFVFSILEKHEVIKGSLYWTSTNVSEGLQALCTTIEMVVFSIIMIFSFSADSYKAINPGQTTSGWKSFFHSQNYSDFLVEACVSLAFFRDYALRKPYTRSTNKPTKATGLDFDQAYAWADRHSLVEENNEVTNDKAYRLGLMHSKVESVAESHRP
ncbi:hypothetical protein MJO28_011429 [Puccinia striiformis f. sp. tritici]|uniref:DUF300-domain-containing protein n=2 Tax=Puccinia striiformis TaxID=27350 RepID=A0A2S4UX28_9BASI|nr:hypothetical protein MJO28_011429 [Puccinia striiformis f. sp. tritici]KAI7946669.1 hypothetical protein MJO29_011196 [Puccinia striiformis f. sp. tritici]POW01822.1 hypothetical protein PSTT_12227 [Puccinia striiformis]